MNTHADKSQENKNQSVANTFSQKQSSGDSIYQFPDTRPEATAQRKLRDIANNNQPLQRKPNNTGLPDNLKAGIENLSGYSMDDVKVHYNSPKPATLQAHAYAQGTDIHLASGQERHLPHEAWHVVQQKQGRVRPTMQMKGNVNINDDAGLEKEADVMGGRAASMELSQYRDVSLISTISSYGNVSAQRFGGGTESEVAVGEAFEDDLQRYSELSGLVRFRFQPQLDGHRDGEMDEEVKKDLLDTKIELIELRAKILAEYGSIKLSSLDPYYAPLLDEILAGRGHEDNVQKVANPQRIGKEIELASVKLASRTVAENGIILASTVETELDLPVLKIETEGADRGTLSIELIYGPLPREEYINEAYQNAQEKLYNAFGSGAMAGFQDIIDNYNLALHDDELRYSLRVSEAGKTCKAKGGKTAKNVQTNVSVSYAAIGDTENGIDNLFMGESSYDFFTAARVQANEIAGEIAHGFPYHNLTSLLTQIIYHDAMYGNLRIKKGEESKVDKQKFHVMFKVSPEDGVFSILSDCEVLALYRWISDTNGEGIKAAVATLLKLTFGTDRKKCGAYAAKISIAQLLKTSHERLLQGKQALSKVSDAEPISTPELGGSIRHSVPRPSNRIPVMQTPDGESHVVIEQRSSKHTLNQS